MPREFRLDIASPLHIGTGEVLSREDLIYERGTAFVPDLDAYFRENPEEITPFVQAMKNGEPASNFINDPNRYAKYTLDPWVGARELGNSEVSVAMKDSEGRPYIPGSSIKGFVRTALAHRALTKGGRSLSSLDDYAVDDLFRLERNDPQNDICRCLTVRDSTPASPDDLVLGEIKMYSLQHSGSMEAKFWSNYAEFIRPGTQLQMELTVDTALLERMVAEFGERRKVEAVFGSDRSEAAVLHTVVDAVTRFGDAIAREDRTLIEGFGEIESFYDGFTDAGAHLRLGHGTGYHSNTVATALSEGDRVEARTANRLGKELTHEDCGGNVTPDRNQDGALFCHKCYTTMPTQSADVSPPLPKTRRFVRDGGTPKYPLGWVAVGV